MPFLHHHDQIIIAVDESKASDQTFSWALDNLWRKGDEIHLIHVIPPGQRLVVSPDLGIDGVIEDDEATRKKVVRGKGVFFFLRLGWGCGWVGVHGRDGGVDGWGCTDAALLSVSLSLSLWLSSFLSLSAPPNEHPDDKQTHNKTHTQLKQEEHALAFIHERFERPLSGRHIPFDVHLIRCDTSTDTVGQVISARAESLEAAAVVMAKHSKGAVKEFFLGSCSSYVIHHCRRPVVVLHCD